MFMQNLNKEDNDVDCQFKNCRVAIGTLIWNLLFNVPVLYQTVFTSADYEARFFLPIHHYELQFNRFNPEKSLRSVRTADYLGEKSVWVVKQESHIGLNLRKLAIIQVWKCEIDFSFLTLSNLYVY